MKSKRNVFSIQKLHWLQEQLYLDTHCGQKTWKKQSILISQHRWKDNIKLHLKQTGRSLWDELCPKKIEVCAILIWNNTKRVSILCLYRAPTGKINCFKAQLEATMIYLEHTKAQLICGDTNINYFIDNNKKDQLQILLNTFNLQQIIDFPTRVDSSSVSLIDNLFWDKAG